MYVSKCFSATAHCTSSGWMSMSLQPAAPRMRCTRSRSANAHIPGFSGSGVGSALGKSGPATRAACVMNGFSAGLLHATNASRASRRAARRMLANAAGGSSKNITPKREMTASNAPGSNA
jgi:hypothetical protein